MAYSYSSDDEISVSSDEGGQLGKLSQLDSYRAVLQSTASPQAASKGALPSLRPASSSEEIEVSMSPPHSPAPAAGSPLPVPASLAAQPPRNAEAKAAPTLSPSAPEASPRRESPRRSPPSSPQRFVSLQAVSSPGRGSPSLHRARSLGAVAASLRNAKAILDGASHGSQAPATAPTISMADGVQPPRAVPLTPTTTAPGGAPPATSPPPSSSSSRRLAPHLRAALARHASMQRPTQGGGSGPLLRAMSAPDVAAAAGGGRGEDASAPAPAASSRSALVADVQQRMHMLSQRSVEQGSAHRSPVAPRRKVFVPQAAIQQLLGGRPPVPRHPPAAAGAVVAQQSPVSMGGGWDGAPVPDSGGAPAAPHAPAGDGMGWSSGAGEGTPPPPAEEVGGEDHLPYYADGHVPRPAPGEGADSVADEGGEGSSPHQARAAPHAVSTPLVRPTVAPGSDLERALAENPNAGQKKGPRLHRPTVLKKLQKMQQGTEEYYKQKEEKLQGKAIHAKHQFYHLSYGMMVGIYTSVVSVPHGSKLTMDDFMEVNKLEFPPSGSAVTQPHQLTETFKMKDYAPKVFHHLRERFGIDRKEYLASLGGAYQYIEFHSNSKSGQFFFFSHDGKFMIKTQTVEESKFLRRILLHYFKHCAQNPGTYLPRFYGMHRLKMKHLNKKVHFVVMHSVFDSGDLPIHEMYDLKGSTVGRAAKPEEKARGPGKVVLKDLDLMESGMKLKLGPTRRAAFLDQLQRDADWLMAQQIMDYSLLLGIRYRHKPHVQGVRRQSVFVGPSSPGGSTPSLADAAAAAVAELEQEGHAWDSEEEDEGGVPAAAAAPARLRPPIAVRGASASNLSARTLPSATSDGSSVASWHSHDSFRQDATAGGAQGAVAAAAAGSQRRGVSFRQPTPAAAAAEGGQSAGGPGRPPPIQLRVDSPPPSAARPSIKTVMSFHGPVAPADRFTSRDLDFFPAACDAVPGSDGDGVVSEEVYYLGIIDILQQYNLRKSGENLLKGLTHDRKAISAVAPKDYAERFVEFMAKHST